MFEIRSQFPKTVQYKCHKHNGTYAQAHTIHPSMPTMSHIYISLTIMAIDAYTSVCDNTIKESMQMGHIL